MLTILHFYGAGKEKKLCVRGNDSKGSTPWHIPNH